MIHLGDELQESHSIISGLIDILDETQSKNSYFKDDDDEDIREGNNMMAVANLITNMMTIMSRSNEHHDDIQNEMIEILHSANHLHNNIDQHVLENMVSLEMKRMDYMDKVINSMKGQIEALYNHLSDTINSNLSNSEEELQLENTMLDKKMNLLWKSVDSLSKLMGSPNEGIDNTIRTIDGEVIVHINQTTTTQQQPLPPGQIDQKNLSIKTDRDSILNGPLSTKSKKKNASKNNNNSNNNSSLNIDDLVGSNSSNNSNSVTPGGNNINHSFSTDGTSSSPLPSSTNRSRSSAVNEVNNNSNNINHNNNNNNNNLDNIESQDEFDINKSLTEDNDEEDEEEDDDVSVSSTKKKGKKGKKGKKKAVSGKKKSKKSSSSVSSNNSASSSANLANFLADNNKISTKAPSNSTSTLPSSSLNYSTTSNLLSATSAASSGISSINNSSSNIINPSSSNNNANSNNLTPLTSTTTSGFNTSNITSNNSPSNNGLPTSSSHTSSSNVLTSTSSTLSLNSSSSKLPNNISKNTTDSPKKSNLITSNYNKNENESSHESLENLSFNLNESSIGINSISGTSEINQPTIKLTSPESPSPSNYNKDVSILQLLARVNKNQEDSSNEDGSGTVLASLLDITKDNRNLSGEDINNMIILLNKKENKLLERELNIENEINTKVKYLINKYIKELNLNNSSTGTSNFDSNALLNMIENELNSDILLNEKKKKNLQNLIEKNNSLIKSAVEENKSIEKSRSKSKDINDDNDENFSNTSDVDLSCITGDDHEYLLDQSINNSTYNKNNINNMTPVNDSNLISQASSESSLNNLNILINERESTNSSKNFNGNIYLTINQLFSNKNNDNLNNIFFNDDIDDDLNNINEEKKEEVNSSNKGKDDIYDLVMDTLDDSDFINIFNHFTNEVNGLNLDFSDSENEKEMDLSPEELKKRLKMKKSFLINKKLVHYYINKLKNRLNDIYLNKFYEHHNEYKKKMNLKVNSAIENYLKQYKNSLLSSTSIDTNSVNGNLINPNSTNNNILYRNTLINSFINRRYPNKLYGKGFPGSSKKDALISDLIKILKLKKDALTSSNKVDSSTNTDSSYIDDSEEDFDPWAFYDGELKVLSDYFGPNSGNIFDEDDLIDNFSNKKIKLHLPKKATIKVDTKSNSSPLRPLTSPQLSNNSSKPFSSPVSSSNTMEEAIKEIKKGVTKINEVSEGENDNIEGRRSALPIYSSHMGNSFLTRTYKAQLKPISLIKKIKNSKNPLYQLYIYFRGVLPPLYRDRLLKASLSFEDQLKSSQTNNGTSPELNTPNSKTKWNQLSSHLLTSIKHLHALSFALVKDLELTESITFHIISLIKNSMANGVTDPIEIIESSCNSREERERLQENLIRLYSMLGELECAEILNYLRISEYYSFFNNFHINSLQTQSQSSQNNIQQISMNQLFSEIPDLQLSYDYFIEAQGYIVEVHRRVIELRDKCRKYEVFRLLTPLADLIDHRKLRDSYSTNQFPPPSNISINTFENLPNEINFTMMSQSNLNPSSNQIQLEYKIRELENELKLANEECEDLEMELMEVVKEKDKTPNAILFFSIMNQHPDIINNIQQLTLQLNHFRKVVHFKQNPNPSSSSPDDNYSMTMMDYPTLRRRLSIILSFSPCLEKLIHNYNNMYKAWATHRKNFFATRKLRGSTADEILSCPLCFQDFDKNSPSNNNLVGNHSNNASSTNNLIGNNNNNLADVPSNHITSRTSQKLANNIKSNMSIMSTSASSPLLNKSNTVLPAVISNKSLTMNKKKI